MTPEYAIRPATAADIDTLVSFTLAEARDAERRTLDVEGARRGVLGAFDTPPRAAYWVAQTAAGRVVGCMSVVTEWSNFLGGNYWWVQSLYILPEHRGQGLVDQMLAHLSAQATAAGALDLRLYGYNTNERALRAYQRCGFELSPYIMLTKPLRGR
ncbi:MAG: N-acetyltransferase family protein [Vicinamibacterales bacterium]